MLGSEYPITDHHSGIFYHMIITCFLLVKLLKLNVIFKISLENADAHPFDDIVVDYAHRSQTFIRLIQCKTKENGIFYGEDLKEIRGSRPFALIKYLRGFINKTRNNFPNVYDLIMCTNASCTNSGVLRALSVDNPDLIPGNPDKLFLHDITPEFVEEYKAICPLDLQQDCDAFFGKLRFWITKRTAEMKGIITDELRELYDGEIVECVFLNLKESYEQVLGDFKIQGYRYGSTNKLYIGRCITQDYLMSIEKKIIKGHNGKLWLNTADPIPEFHGMKGSLDKLKEYEHFCVVYGAEGVGKTQIALKFAQQNDFEHCIFVDAKNKEDIEESYRRIAFHKLRIRETDFRGNVKDISSIFKDVSEYFGGSRAIFIFDNAQESIQSLPTLENGFVLVTTRESSLYPNGPKVELNGFDEIEAYDFIENNLPGENSQDISKLAQFCSFNPKKIKDALDTIKSTNKKKKILNINYSISNFLSTSDR